MKLGLSMGLGAGRGVIPIREPLTAHIRVTGDDTTGDGSAGNPFATFHAAAIDPRHFAVYDFGVGEFSDTDFPGHTGDLTLTIRGVAGSVISGFTYHTDFGATINLTLEGPVYVSSINGSAFYTDGGFVNVHAEAGATVAAIDVTGGSGGVVDEVGQDGHAGGTVNVYGPFTLLNTPTVNGGFPGSGAFSTGNTGPSGSWTAHNGTITP